MKAFLFFLITIVCPWMPFVVIGELGYALGALLLQLSVIGWVPAIVWSRKAWDEDMKAMAADKKQQELKAYQAKLRKQQADLAASSKPTISDETIERLESPKE